ncbi:hypothetical protein HWI79_3385 [Cryptosporidium felis]|nr:hypothetical protein HWI79_3385 [Cryptosporidium felis]
MKRLLLNLAYICIFETVRGTDEFSGAPGLTFGHDSSLEYSDELYEQSASFQNLDFSPSGSVDHTQSMLLEDESLQESSLFNPFRFELEARESVLCEEDFCKRGLFAKKSLKLFKVYTRNVLKQYIQESKVRSWFFRLWSESTVMTSPVLFVGKKSDFQYIYKTARKSYQKLKDSSVVIILKVSTKKIPHELRVEERDEEEEISKSSDEEEGYSRQPFRDSEGERNLENIDENSSIAQAIKTLCIKLRGLSKHKLKDNGQSYLFVIEAFEITTRESFSKLMSNVIQTSCWNRANPEKSRVVIPVIIGKFTELKESGVAIGRTSGRRRSSSDRRRKRSSGTKPRGDGRKNADSARDLQGSELSSSISPQLSIEKNSFGFQKDEFGPDQFDNLFVKWLKRCNESKIIFEKYEKKERGLFKRLLLHYFVYAISNKTVSLEISSNENHFMTDYPLNCQGSWSSLLFFLEAKYNESDVLLKMNIINTILESLLAANNTLFKEQDGLEEGTVPTSEDQQVQTLPMPEAFKSNLEKSPGVCELYSIISGKDLPPVSLSDARVLDDLLVRIELLPDKRRSRLEFKDYLAKISSEHSKKKPILELFEAVDYVQNSLHLIRAMFISHIDLGLTTNPLELLVSVCRNAKLIPPGSQDKPQELGKKGPSSEKSEPSNEEEVSNRGGGGEDTNRDEEEEGMDSCNPFGYLQEEVMAEDYSGDLMESLQKSSVKLVSLLLRQSQYNLRILALHVSNLAIKTERLMLSSLLEKNRIPSLVLVLSEKVQTFPFNVLSSFSYLKEVYETRIPSILKPYIPLFPSYTLVGLFGESLGLSSQKDFGRVLLMEICQMYYDPNRQLEAEFIRLCSRTWEYSGLDDQEYHKSISEASLTCKKLSSEGMGEGKSRIGKNSPTVFLICDLLEKLQNGPSSRSSGLENVRNKYIPKEFREKCENAKSYSIQQSGSLYNQLSYRR